MVAPKKKKGKKLVVLIFFILLLGLSAGAVYFFGPFRAPEPPVVPVPVNRNRNVNRNVNENVNVNENLNVNANVNVNQNVNVPLRSGPDADSDGLTDTEEKALYRTNPNTQDSDADSFNDGNEVFHLFDPTKPAPSMLVDSGLVSLVVNSAHRYQILVPAGWGQRGNESAEFFATAPSGEFIEVLVTEKPAAQSLLEWLAAISPGTKAEEVERFRTKNDYDALRSPDRLTAYIDGGPSIVSGTGMGRVYAVTYNVDDRTDIDFRTTYEMMIASFMLVR